MSDIGPGDYVECVNASTAAKAPWKDGPGLHVGRVYVVSETFINANNSPVVLLGWERVLSSRIHGFRCGYGVERFRRIYRPKADLIAGLLKPVETAPEKVPA